MLQLKGHELHGHRHARPSRLHGNARGNHNDLSAVVVRNVVAWVVIVVISWVVIVEAVAAGVSISWVTIAGAIVAGGVVVKAVVLTVVGLRTSVDDMMVGG